MISLSALIEQAKKARDESYAVNWDENEKFTELASPQTILALCEALTLSREALVKLSNFGSGAGFISQEALAEISKLGIAP